MANKKFECEICKIFTTDQASLDNHFLGSKHQLALHRNLVKEKKEKCGIYVTGFLKTAKKEDIMQFFSKFGKIVDCHTGPQGTFAIIQFAKEEVAQEILNKRLTFQGRYLNIRPRIMKNTPEIHGPPKQDPHFERIFNLVRQEPTFDTQLAKLVNVLQVHEKFLDPPNYNRVCGELEQCLRSKFPFCRVWPFGSTVSGLGFINSDVDIYVDVVKHLDLQSSSESPAAVYTRIARNVLSKSNIFTNVIAIPKAKTPIVKLIHRPTGINCDLNFKNMLGVCNSLLIRFLLGLDVRLRPFMFIIKYWAKVNEISGSGKISNYGIVLMAVFYLQRIPFSILPPIEVFQTNTSSRVEGWNGSFIENPNLVPPICRKNNLDIIGLLHGFFSFWAKFDYGFNVICPLTGEILPKSDFSNPDTLSKSFLLYKTNLSDKEPLKTDSPICLQDPIELNHNVTGYVAARQLEDFQKFCEISADIVLKNKSTDILPKLFTKLQVEKVIAASDEKCIFKIPGTAVNLSDEKTDDPKHVQKLWFEKVNQFLVSVLSKLFLFEVTARKDEQQSKAQKLDGQSDIHDTTVVDILTFHCVGYNNVWEARKGISKNLGHLLNKPDFIENEIAISEYIVNVLCKGLNIKDPLVDFNLTVNFKVNPTEAEFVLSNVNSRKNSFRVMANFFASKVPVWFVRYLKDFQNVQNKKNTDDKPDKQTQTQEEKEIIEISSNGDD